MRSAASVGPSPGIPAARRPDLLSADMLGVFPHNWTVCGRSAVMAYITALATFPGSQRYNMPVSASVSVLASEAVIMI